MRKPLAAEEATGQAAVAAIGIAQEYQSVFACNLHEGSAGVQWFTFTKADRWVTCYYFYLWNTDFGAAFINICSPFPTRSMSG